jgi:cyclase
MPLLETEEVTLMKKQTVLPGELKERPAGYQGPNLDPAGLVLQPQQLGQGVYALMANIPPKDNNGVIIGSKAALVIDAGINGAVSRQIHDIVAGLTELPLRYLVNTTYHGDHTFGNYAFAEDVVVISSRLNRESMSDLDVEKGFRSRNLYGNDAGIADVTTWRRPDVVFEEYCEIDLGDRVVELYHFGPGNGVGDVVVYEPTTKAAWTGNFLGRAGVCPMLLEGGPGPYVESLTKMRQAIAVKTVVSGHGPMGDGPDAIDTMIGYLQGLEESVGQAVRAGRGLEPTVEETVLPTRFAAPDLPAPARQMLGQLNTQMHRLNIVATYRALEHAAA